MTDTAGTPALPPVAATAPEQGTQAANARAMAAVPMPGQRGSMMRPTERPNEPVTAGLSTGPGPGPGPMGVTPLDRVRAAYSRLPSDQLRMVMETMERAEARGQT